MDSLCRVCMAPGSYRLFRVDAVNNITNNAGNNQTYPSNSRRIDANNVSSFDKLLEKLRYVTMLQINDRTSEAKMLCDLCIIQLNVAYNFKRLANKSAVEMEQCLIEMGVADASTTTTSTMQITAVESSVATASHCARMAIEKNSSLTIDTIRTSPEVGGALLTTPTSTTASSASLCAAEPLLVPKIEQLDTSPPHTNAAAKQQQRLTTDYLRSKNVRARRSTESVTTPSSTSQARNAGAGDSSCGSKRRCSPTRSSTRLLPDRQSPSALSMAMVHVSDGKAFNLHDNRSDLDFINTFMPVAGRKNRASLPTDAVHKRLYRRMYGAGMISGPATRSSRSNSSGVVVDYAENRRKRPSSAAGAVKPHYQRRI